MGETAELENPAAEPDEAQIESEPGQDQPDGAQIESEPGQDHPDEAQIESEQLQDEQELERSGERHGDGDGVNSVDGLKQELDSARAQAEEYLDGWQRARAEFANYKKRVTRDQEEARTRIAGETISKYLGVVDDLERALRERPQDGDAAAWAAGIELIYRKLMTLLESEGVQVIRAEGDEFDPTLHEALSHEESGDHLEGQVIEVIQPGYRIGERVLRPALVRVAK